MDKIYYGQKIKRTRISYEKEVKLLVDRMQSQFIATRNAELKVSYQNGKYSVGQIYANNSIDILYTGTLKEVHCFLKGMAEFLI